MDTHRNPSSAPDTAAVATLRQHLSDVSDVAAGLTDAQILQFRYPVGEQTYTDGSVTWRSIVIGGKSCQQVTFLDAGGQVATGAGGSATVLLSSVICSQINAFAAPVNLEATAVATKPFFVTSQYSLVANPAVPGSFNDLQITLYAWDPNGAPASGVTVDWRCRLVNIPIIL